MDIIIGTLPIFRSKMRDNRREKKRVLLLRKKTIVERYDLWEFGTVGVPDFHLQSAVLRIITVRSIIITARRDEHPR